MCVGWWPKIWEVVYLPWSPLKSKIQVFYRMQHYCPYWRILRLICASKLCTLLGNFVHYWKKLYTTLFCPNRNWSPVFSTSCELRLQFCLFKLLGSLTTIKSFFIVLPLASLQTLYYKLGIIVLHLWNVFRCIFEWVRIALWWAGRGTMCVA